MNNIVIAGIDSGGSGTRVAYIRGGKKYKRSVASRLKSIPEDSKIYTDIADPTDDFKITSKEYNGRYVKGDAIANYIAGEIIQPDNQRLKVQQEVTYLNIIHALSKILLPLELPEDEITDFVLGVCIPVAEFCSASGDLISEVKERLAGLYEVYYPVLKRTVRFQLKKNSVFVSGEGLAYAMTLKKDVKYKDMFVSGDGLIVDIGRRSTDITPMRKGMPLKGAVRSVPTGGIQVESMIISEAELLNRPITNNEIGDVIVSGEINGYNISDIIIKAKRKLASDIYEEIVNSLATARFSATNLAYIVFIGQLFTEGEELSGSEWYKGNMKKYCTEKFPEGVTIITPADQQYANALSMVTLVEAAYAAKV